ncbi:FtsX-like permease family protein [Cryptosporangium sp. NPDC051539]|uniref:ABC transporter permease n=1 Tax=Cryptosporangium sp. NPDC051539 TaxID=3363962 RepID=UPI0037AB2475
MLTVALGTLRSRWPTFVTTLLTLTLGVALIAAAGVVIAGTLSAPDRPPRRYAGAPVVVTPVDELRVATANGARPLPLAESRGLPSEVVARIRRLGPAVVDREFPAAVLDAPAATAGAADAEAATARGAEADDGRPGEGVGRPWSAAALGHYRLVAGRTPRKAGEVVVRAGVGEVGKPVSVLTADGARTYAVVGWTEAVPFERAVFFTDAEAARLSPRVAAVASFAGAASVRAAVGDEGRTWTGVRRRELDPDHRTDAEALVAANSVVATAAGVSGFVALFVIASTFAYAVATRRRELALLRTAGATPGQIRRSVVLEGLLLGTAGSLAGCALGGPAARWMASWLVGNGLAPPWFVVANPRWPFVVAFVAGVLTAWLGVAAAAYRAGRVRPVEALRESAVESAPMTPGRWAGGLVSLGGALYLLAEPVVVAPAEALKRKHYLPATMLLLVGVALLAPLLVPPFARLFGGAFGLLARQAVRSAARRTASTAAPVVLTAGLAGCVLLTTATIDAAKSAEARTSDYVVVPAAGPVIGPDVVARVRGVAGARVNTVRPTFVYAEDGDATVVRHTARAVDRAAGLPVLSGDLSALDDRSIVVDTDFGWSVGDDVRVWLADGSPRSLRVVAVVREGAGGNGAFVTGRHAGRAPVERIEVGVAPGADAATVVRGLRDAVRGRGAQFRRAADGPEDSRAQTLGLRVILGLAVVLAVLSIAGTSLMAARDRRRESVLLGLAGGTPAQVVRAACAEALLVAALGLLIAGSATAATGGALWLCLLRLTGEPMAVVVPWGSVGAVAALCVGVTVGAALVPMLTAASRRAG